MPSRLGSLENGGSAVDLATPPATPAGHTPSTLKKTVNLLSPEVLTSWYERRRGGEALYGPRRNSISNLFFQPAAGKQSSPLTELRSMLSLEGLAGGVGDGVTVQRSESAKLAGEARRRWRGKGIQRSESARLLTLPSRSPALQPRQNSQPNLSRLTQSYSSSCSSLADRSSLDSPSKLTTCSVSSSDTPVQPCNSDSDLEAEADPPDWRISLPEPELARLSSSQLKRQDVINELFHTERSHVRNLKVLDLLFRRPLLDTGRMPRDLLDRLFPNLEEVLALHTRHNNAMKTRLKAGFPVGDICDILDDMFLDSSGDKLVRVCGEFIKNQHSSIEELKRLRGRDAKLEQFLSDTERRPACRRLQLQSLLPCVHTRLVKYPLLLERVLAATPRHQPEWEAVRAATERTKEILESIDRLVAQQQNLQKLAEMQAGLDTNGLDKLGGEHPTWLEYRNLDLTRHTLLHDGTLTMKLGDSKRVKALHALLLEDCLMLLQRQGDKFLLKFHSSSGGQAGPGREDSRRLLHSPVIKYSTMLVRPVATDKRSFYLLNTTERGPQIYELLANSGAERAKWIKCISDASAAHKAGLAGQESGELAGEAGKLGWEAKRVESPALRSQSFREQTGSPRLERADRQNSSPPEAFNIPAGEADNSPPDPPSVPQKRLQRVEILKIVDAPPMVEPHQVRVAQARVLLADPVISPLERLRQKDEEVSRILEEKQRIIGEILEVPEQEFHMVADLAGEAGPGREAREILLAALAQAQQLTTYVAGTLTVNEAAAVAGGAGGAEAGRGSEQLVSITASMNHHLTELLAALQDKEVERETLRRELSRSQQQIREFFSDSARSSYISLESEAERPSSLLSLETEEESDTEDSSTAGQAGITLPVPCSILHRQKYNVNLFQ